MTRFVFAALIVPAVIVILLGTMAVALRRSAQDQVTKEETWAGIRIVEITGCVRGGNWFFGPHYQAQEVRGLVQVPQCRQYRALGLIQFVHLAR
jgi:hypothetical protein